MIEEGYKGWVVEATGGRRGRESEKKKNIHTTRALDSTRLDLVCVMRALARGRLGVYRLNYETFCNSFGFRQLGFECETESM